MTTNIVIGETNKQTKKTMSLTLYALMFVFTSGDYGGTGKFQVENNNNLITIIPK